MYLQKVISKQILEKYYFSLASRQLLTKKAGQGSGSGSVPKYYGPTTLPIGLIRGHKALIGSRFFKIKIAYYYILGLRDGFLSSRRSLQHSRTSSSFNHKKFLYLFFLFCMTFLSSWIRIQNHESYAQRQYTCSGSETPTQRCRYFCQIIRKNFLFIQRKFTRSMHRQHLYHSKTLWTVLYYEKI
jgi:hypothetical protein